MNDVPIALMVFNRPDLTKKVMDQIAKVRPPILYVIADGSRNKNEINLCKQTREIALNPNWPCKVIPFLRNKNVGMVRQFKEGLDFVFEDNECLIFIEDDHFLEPSFYKFACEMLHKYRFEDRISHINLSNLCPDFSSSCKFSYFFSKYFSVWGFATWKRTWKTYNTSMPEWKYANQNSILNEICFSIREKKGIKRMFDLHCDNNDPWTYDYQYMFNCIHLDTLSIIPKFNLCINIGFERKDSTHNKGVNPFQNKLNNLTYPYSHPNDISRNKQYDKKLSHLICPSYFSLIKGKFIDKLKYII